MMKSKWQKFPAFGDKGILHIATTSSSIDGIRILDGNNKVPYVTRSDTNNGIARFVSDRNYKFGSDKAGSITVGLDTQTAFYQPHKFVTGQNIQVITGKNLSKNTAHFLTTILRNQMRAKFNWGGNGATLGRMKRLDVMLPITNKGTPDWNYMSSFVKSKREDMLQRYKNYVAKRISELEYKKIPELNDVEWKPFYIGNLFDKVVPGKGKGLNHLIKSETGDIPYVGATNRNNGVMCFVENNNMSNKMLLTGGCVGFIKNGDGSAGYAIYKRESFISTNDVIFGYKDGMNEFIGLFIVVAQDMIEHKYSHGYKRNRKRLIRDRIMLPVTANGQPDYAYMEQYIKNIMLKKYQQYLSYIEKQEK